MLNIIPKPNKITEYDGACICKNIKEIDEKITYSIDTAIAPDGYKMRVSAEKIAIAAGSENGAFYARQTLREISGELFKEADFTIPCCEIEDAPKFMWRGIMLDEARHFLGKETVKQTLEMMALFKMNKFHWHLSDDQGWRIQLDKYPLLTEVGSKRAYSQTNIKGDTDEKAYGEGMYYTKDDIREIVSFAKKLHIEVIPEIDMPGHLTAAIACYPRLSCKGEKLDVSPKFGIRTVIGCAGKENLYNFAYGVIDELCECFPSEYFHIGGDEAPKKEWKTCPDCQAAIKKNGLKNETELQGYFNKKILDYLKTKGKKLIGWNEILHATTLDKDTIVQWWTGNAEKNGVKKWTDSGYGLILSRFGYVYFDYPYAMTDLVKTYSVAPSLFGIDSDRVLGIEAPLWTEYVTSKAKFDFNLYPRLLAVAEKCWTDEGDFADFNTRLQAFLPYLSKEGIGYAPERIYVCRGIKGFIRRLRFVKWLKNPDYELSE